jgi:GTP pyrophosphokinase
VNGIIKPIGYRPETGDVIEIITTKHTITASKYWVDFLNTPSARSRLSRYFHQLEKEELVKK